MALKIRLTRGGAKKRPYYRIVIAEATSPRDGRFLEKVGAYNPMVAQDHPERLTLNEERIKHWLSVGAQPTDRVARFLGKAGLIEARAYRETPTKSAPKKNRASSGAVTSRQAAASPASPFRTARPCSAGGVSSCRLIETHPNGRSADRTNARGRRNERVESMRGDLRGGGSIP